MNQKIKNLFDKINIQAVNFFFISGAVVILSSHILFSNGLNAVGEGGRKFV